MPKNSLLEWIIASPVRAALLLFFVAGLVVVWIVNWDVPYATVDFEASVYDKVVETLTPILFVGLLVERLLEVFVSGGRKHDRQPLERSLLKSKEKLNQLDGRRAALQAQLDSPGAKVLSDPQRSNILARLNKVADHVPEAQRNYREADAALEKFKGETRKIAYVLGTLMGLVIGLAGVRALSPVVKSKVDDWEVGQQILFHGADVALTAALLAGGAAGIHQVISVFGDYTKKARKGAEA